jgi:hypothetical protein
MPRSQANNRIFPLVAGGTFTGVAESTAAGVAISVSVLVPTECTLTIQQSYDKATWFISEQYPIPANAHKTVQQAVGLEFFRVILLNNGITQTFCHLISTLSTSLTQNVNIRNLEASRDTVVVSGQEPQHVFYASPDTNIAAVYADGVQGTDVNGGWQYINTGVGTNKINWYLYANTVEQGATAKKIKDIDFMYAVIDQKTTLGLEEGQNPFFIFYSLPDSGTNAAWYKSKFFYGSNAHTDISGVKLLYIGTDVATIHPEITGINRIPLDFVAGQSTKTVEQGAEELLWLGSLQTTGNPQPVAGAFNFVFSEYGINFAEEALNLTILPIVANKVQAEVTGTVTTIKPDLITQTQVINAAAAGLASNSFDLGTNSLFDCLLLAAGTVVTGNVRLDYSIDNTNWVPDNTNAVSLSTADPHAVYRGISSGSRYVRVSSGATSSFTATTLTIRFSSKLN